ncbi:cilia- and flagella-associated protein 20-like isoform X3 [Phycodurus eques]|uniref:cilia- and flagella-associated protein 20-like isoform X3 n=1 Tax=Phycodurus eques TaxID=693459 RepID=UPI002ACDA3CB|nr:cilia- and flagella-associated protein 20-like isoform X3 [Phycodurus eques]
MFRSTFQGGFLSILYSIGSKPLQIWEIKVKNGHIKRVTDNDINSLVLEVEGSNVSTNYITCPADPRQTLGIKMPFLVMIVKKTRKYFSFEVQVLDDQNLRRRFRTSPGGPTEPVMSRRSVFRCVCAWTAEESDHQMLLKNPRKVMEIEVIQSGVQLLPFY